MATKGAEVKRWHVDGVGYRVIVTEKADVRLESRVIGRPEGWRPCPVENFCPAGIDWLHELHSALTGQIAVEIDESDEEDEDDEKTNPCFTPIPRPPVSNVDTTLCAADGDGP